MFTDRQLEIIRDALFEHRVSAKKADDPARYNALTVLIGSVALAPAFIKRRRDKAAALLTRVSAFVKQSAEEEYTDTDEVWELLLDLKKHLRIVVNNPNV